MILLFDDTCCVVGSLLGECLVVVLVLCFGFVGFRSRGDASKKCGWTKHSIKWRSYVLGI